MPTMHTTRTRLLAAGSNMLLAAAVLVFLALVVIPHLGARRTYTVLSGSMNPGIPTGALIFAARMPVDQVHKGQVITFHAPIDGHPVVTHRVLRITRAGDHFLIHTKGDANKSADPWIASTSAESQVWHPQLVVPYAGRVVSGLRRVTPRYATQSLVILTLLAGIAIIWRRPVERTRPPDDDWYVDLETHWQ